MPFQLQNLHIQKFHLISKIFFNIIIRFKYAKINWVNYKTQKCKFKQQPFDEVKKNDMIANDNRTLDENHMEPILG